MAVKIDPTYKLILTDTLKMRPMTCSIESRTCLSESLPNANFSEICGEKKQLVVYHF